MKKILAILSILTLGVLNGSYAQFQANLSNKKDTLVFKIKPTSAVNAGFSTVEFFVRYPETTPAFTYGDIIENSTNFPGIGNFSIDATTIVVNGMKYSHFVYTAPEPITTAKDYIAGTEYEVFRVPLMGPNGATANFELVHKEDFQYYLALTNGVGADVAVTDITTYFYPATTITGTAGTRVAAQTVIDVPLPVNFLNFFAIKSGENAKLSWSVDNDGNNAYFEIERSNDGKNYSFVTKVAALNNGKSVNTYEIADNAILTNTIYYRIKQVDKAGAMSYSTIRNLNFNAKETISLSPNPARISTKLIFDSKIAGKATIIIRDIAGRQVQLINTNLIKGLNQYTLNVRTLSAGEYNITIAGTSGLNQSVKLSRVN